MFVLLVGHDDKTVNLSETCKSSLPNKVVKQCILLAFIVRIYHDERSSECQNKDMVLKSRIRSSCLNYNFQERTDTGFSYTLKHSSMLNIYLCIKIFFWRILGLVSRTCLLPIGRFCTIHTQTLKDLYRASTYLYINVRCT